MAQSVYQISRLQDRTSAHLCIRPLRLPVASTLYAGLAAALSAISNHLYKLVATFATISKQFDIYFRHIRQEYTRCEHKTLRSALRVPILISCALFSTHEDINAEAKIWGGYDGCLPFTKNSRKFRLEYKWHTIVALENSRDEGKFCIPKTDKKTSVFVTRLCSTLLTFAKLMYTI